ncbi:inositol monophosphatase family protein [Marinomonas balearica]|uniref:Inositol-1-monophosphatase n=1 Tax=Marinomonas balearica TaxID=491947 RepID=A0A4R6M3Y9_9GAMM|nr:inositol monophosphatase family protein [Marinomonas balearica]TDO96018.1 myo-inositol-1(or 4)-monophosphatase [Marinomonas balearica]
MAALAEYLVFAKKLAHHAGVMMLEARQSSTFESDYKSGHELVTSVDIAVDDYLCSQIREQYPEHDIFSEESTPDLLICGENSAPVWVIDPIDGTVNFAHGLPHVAVSIGLYINGKRQLGVVEAPFLGQTYWAVLGSGAYCNDEKISVSNQENLRNALVATGFPYRKETLTELVPKVGRILEHCQDVRRNGSAALDLCAVAHGFMDAYYESVKPWDMAAGAIIAEEAGASIGHFGDIRKEWPEALNGDCLLVSTPKIYEQLASLLK